MYRRLLLIALAGVLAHGSGTPESLAAQQPQAGSSAARRIPVTVVLVERLPRGAGSFEILRRVDEAPGDVILLSSDAGASELSEAVRTLLLARRIDGDRPTADAVLRMRPKNDGAQRPVLPWAPRVLNDLRRAPARQIPGVGSAASVEIWLPPQHPRQS